MNKKLYSYWLVAPVMLLYLVFFILPAVIGMYYSFTDWNTYLPEIHFTGFENFKYIFRSRELINCLKNTFVFAVTVVVFKNLFGLLLAVALNSKMKGRNIFRVIIYLPAIMSTIVIGLIFTRVLHPEGMLNRALADLGLGMLQNDWLVNPKIIMFAIAGVSIWQWTGYHMAIYLAGLQSISESYYEAADIDGANFLQKLWYITLPLLRATININVIFSLIGGIKVFSEVYILTGGGPGNISQVLSTEVFAKFGEGSWGMGTALNTLLMLFVSVICIPLLIYMRRQEVEE